MAFAPPTENGAQSPLLSYTPATTGETGGKSDDEKYNGTDEYTLLDQKGLRFELLKVFNPRIDTLG